MESLSFSLADDELLCDKLLLLLSLCEEVFSLSFDDDENPSLSLCEEAVTSLSFCGAEIELEMSFPET